MRFLVLALMMSGAAFAKVDCDYRITLSNAVLNIQESTQVVQQNFVLNREAQADGTCQLYRVFFSKGSANSYTRKAYNSSGASIEYNLHSSITMIGTLKQYGDAFLPTEYLSGIATATNQNYQGRFFVSVPGMTSQNSYNGGIYTDNVQVSFYGFIPSLGTYILDDVETFTVSIIVPTKINISVVDEGASFDASSTSKVLNFGYLSVNQEKAADIRVVSNTSYKIQLSSQNNGNMKHSSSNSVIGYQMKVNGTAIGLNSSATSPVTIGTGDRTGSSGNRYNTRVTITTNTDNKTAGTYEDVITITAIAN